MIGETVGFLVLVAEDMLNLEGLEAGDAAFGFFVERAEVGAFDFVLAFDLLGHQLGIGNDTVVRVVVAEREFKRGEQAGVFGEIVGADPQELAEFGQLFTIFALYVDPVAGGPGIAAGSSVAESGDGVRLRRKWNRRVDRPEQGRSGL